MFPVLWAVAIFVANLSKSRGRLFPHRLLTPKLRSGGSHADELLVLISGYEAIEYLVNLIPRL
jgi:hypothetical protein